MGKAFKMKPSSEMNPKVALQAPCMLEQTDLSLFYGASVDESIDNVTSYVRICYDICCPVEKLFIYILLLYFSPIIFPGLLNKDFASIKNACLLSTSSVANKHICKALSSQHFNSCTRLLPSPPSPLPCKRSVNCQLELLLNSFDVEFSLWKLPHP